LRENKIILYISKFGSVRERLLIGTHNIDTYVPVCQRKKMRKNELFRLVHELML